jgi:Transposase, Mutator family
VSSGRSRSRPRGIARAALSLGRSASARRAWPASTRKILDLYAGGMTVRDIAGHLRDLCGVEIARDTISRVTDAQFAFASCAGLPVGGAFGLLCGVAVRGLFAPDEVRIDVASVCQLEGERL